MEDIYNEFIVRVGNMGFTGQLAPTLHKMDDQHLHDVIDFLFEKYDTDLWRGQNKSNNHIAKVMNRMSLGHFVKDGNMVNMQNKKMMLALDGVVEKLIDKFGQDELFHNKPNKKTFARTEANKENAANFKPMEEDKGQKRQYEVIDFDAKADAEDVFGKKAKLARTPQHKEDPFARKATVMRTPVQPAEPSLEGTHEDVFAKRAHVMRTPVQPTEEGNREDVFAKKAKVIRTPVQPTESISEGNRDDVFANKAKVMRTPLQPAQSTEPNAGGVIEAPFGNKAKVLRSPVKQSGLSGDDDGGGLAKNSKVIRSSVEAPEAAARDVFAKKSKLTRTPAHQVSHVQASTVQADNEFAQQTYAHATNPSLEDQDQIFGKKTKLQRTPAPPALQPSEQEDVFGKKSKLQRTPAQAITTEDREEAFMKKSKLARTPVQTTTSTSTVAPAPPPATRESLDAFSSKSKIQRSPVETDVASLPAVLVSQLEPAQESEDDITIMQFDTAITAQKTAPNNHPKSNPQPSPKSKPSTPSQKPKPIQSTQSIQQGQHPPQTTQLKDGTAPRTPTRPISSPSPSLRTPLRATNSQTPSRSINLRTPPRSARSVTGTSPRHATAPFNDVTSAYSNVAYPRPVLRTPISEKTGSLLTPMKNGQLLENRTPLASASKHTITRSPSSVLKSANKKLKTPTKMVDPSILNPSLLRPDPFDYAEEAEEPVVIEPISFNLEPTADKPTSNHIIDKPRNNPIIIKPKAVHKSLFTDTEKPPPSTPSTPLSPASSPVNRMHVERPISAIEKPPVVPEIPLGEAEAEYLKEREKALIASEEALIASTYKAELENVNKQIKQVTQKHEMIQYQIERLDVDISGANKLKQATLQRIGPPAHPLPDPPALASELARLKTQQKSQEAKLKAARATKRDQPTNLQVVEQQIREVSRDIEARETELKALRLDDRLPEFTVRELDIQIHAQMSEYEAVIREEERCRREIEHLRQPRLHAPPPPPSLSSERGTKKEKAKAKRRVDNMIVKTKMLDVISSSLRNVEIMMRNI